MDIQKGVLAVSTELLSTEDGYIPFGGWIPHLADGYPIWLPGENNTARTQKQNKHSNKNPKYIFCSHDHYLSHPPSHPLSNSDPRVVIGHYVLSLLGSVTTTLVHRFTDYSTWSITDYKLGGSSPEC
jgi:hypothetical protein